MSNSDVWKEAERMAKAQHAPEKPSAPREVTTENFDRIDPDGRGWIPQSTAREFLKRDIRANVERETKGLREKNARLRGEVERLTKELRSAKDDASRADGGKADALKKYEDERVDAVRLRAALSDAKDANREQRRAGAIDAVAWMKYNAERVPAESLNDVLEALDRGEVLRGAEKHEHAPEKTGRLPGHGHLVFVRINEGCQWFLAPAHKNDAGQVYCLVPFFDGAAVILTTENEGVLWCWPRPGMV